MKFAISFVVLALVACAQSATVPPADGKFTSNTLFEGDINEIQGMMIDIASAGEDLAKIENGLAQVVANKENFDTAEKLLEAAVDKNDYKNSWKPT